MQKKNHKARKINPNKKSGIKNIEKVLQELKEELRRIYGERFLKLIFYGSYARANMWNGAD